MQLPEYQNIFEQETTHWWYKTLHNLVEKVVGREYKNNNYKIFDAGCGTGRMMEIMSSYGAVEGIDYSPLAVSFAKKRGLVNVYEEDLYKWDCPPESYNLITSLDVLYSLDDDMAVLKKIYAALKPGGTLVLNLPAFEILRRQHDVVVNTKRRYHKKDLIKALKKTGFSITTASYRQMHLFLFIFLRKMFGKITGSDSRAQSDLKKTPHWLNSVLEKTGSVENFLIMRGIQLPVGSSLFIVAKK